MGTHALPTINAFAFGGLRLMHLYVSGRELMPFLYNYQIKTSALQVFLHFILSIDVCDEEVCCTFILDNKN